MRYFFARRLSPVIAIIFWAIQVIGIPTGKAESSRKSWFEAGPKSQYGFFLLSEFGYLPRIALNSKLPESYYDKSFLFTWELGLMLNVSEKNALGFSLYAAADDEGSRYGAKARFRRWFSHGFSLDFAPGILLDEIDSHNEKYPGFTGQMGLNLNWLTLATQLEIIPVETYFTNELGDLYKARGNEVAWYVGLKLNSDPGFLGCLASIIVVPMLVYVFDPDDRVF
ncbi:MAG: hypothetical protein A2142_02210 [candidate division Zixibacteria bacterium RBG_16_48_11]|nr:MAG: hypothetical protein A2142_02210 [candidate division Zixibacteria bacterium RBG_16_48_11]